MLKMNVFAEEANSYDGWYNTKMGSFVDKVETDCIFGLFKVQKGMRILDVGCGTGNFSIKLAKMGCEVVAIDISKEMLKIAEKKAKEESLGIEFYHMDVHNMGFEDNCFDGVVSVTAFEFLSDPKNAMEEMFRVLRPNGQLVIGTINRDSEWGKMYSSKKAGENSVFKYADLKTMEDLKGFKSDYLVDTGECLFIPPNADENDICLDKEQELAIKGERGGFICALWEK